MATETRRDSLNNILGSIETKPDRGKYCEMPAERSGDDPWQRSRVSMHGLVKGFVPAIAGLIVEARTMFS